jgi:hypothetical protein
MALSVVSVDALAAPELRAAACMLFQLLAQDTHHSNHWNMGNNTKEQMVVGRKH